MWREIAVRFNVNRPLANPVEASRIVVIEESLGQEVPGDLRSLLQEVDGIQDQLGTDVVWKCDDIIANNLTFRSSQSFRELYADFRCLLFFGDNGGGDQFAFSAESDRREILVWDHETDDRFTVSNSLEEYVFLALSADGEDWYRE